MIVDDSKTIRKTGEEFLTQAGCVVMLAEDGFDCIAKVRDFEPDFFFIDVILPSNRGHSFKHSSGPRRLAG
jgi:twitching motility two-component system response regulator PilG